MMGWYPNGWMWGTSGWLGMLMMVAFWALLIAGAGWTILRVTRSDSRPSALESPRAILDRRFASGEIDAEEYARVRHDLESRGAPNT